MSEFNRTNERKSLEQLRYGGENSRFEAMVQRPANVTYVGECVREFLSHLPVDHVVCVETAEWLFALQSRGLRSVVADAAHEAGYLLTGENGFRRYGTKNWNPLIQDTKGDRS